MKLLLISPAKPENEGEHWDSKFTSFVSGQKRYGYIPLAFPTIASLTPDDFSIKIIDEHIEKINYNERADIVGISCHTSLAKRAYEIADEFRKRNIKVILGGIHPSMLPEEAIQHSDSVVIGEAENTWHNLIDDFKNNKLKQIYRSDEKPDLDKLPVPRFDLIRTGNYSSNLIQTSRGCPYDCEFCSIKPMLGNKYRFKPIDSVIREIETLNNTGKKMIFFTDDNFTGNRARAVELITKLIKYDLTYIVQVPISIAKDDELLELFNKSKCKKFYIGFESISEDNLKEMNKPKCNKAEEYAKNIEIIQSHGIEIYGSFMFGCDNDNENVFEKTVQFINETNIASPVLNILTPFPGTRLYQRLYNENRLINKDWSYYDGTHVCFKPKNMSPDSLLNGYLWSQQQIYSYESIFKRLNYIWALWNKNNVRLWDRTSPILTNLAFNNTAYSSAKAFKPDDFNA